MLLDLWGLQEEYLEQQALLKGSGGDENAKWNKNLFGIYNEFAALLLMEEP